MIEEEVSSVILDKINSGDFNFTDSDIYFIKLNNVLIESLVEYIYNHPEIDLSKTFDVRYLDIIFNSNYFEDHLSDKKVKPFLFEYVKLATFNNKIYVSNFRDFFDEEYQQKYLDYVKDLFAQGIELNLLEGEIDDLLFFLENNQFKSVEKSRNLSIGEDTLSLISPYIDKLNVVPKYISSIMDVPKEKLPLDLMLYYFDKNDEDEKQQKENSDIEYSETRYNITIDDIFNRIKSYDTIPNEMIIEKYLGGIIRSGKKEEFFKLLLQKGYIKGIASLLSNENINTYEDDIIKCIENSNSDLSNFYLNNEKIKKALIYNNRFADLFRNSLTFSFENIVPDFKTRFIKYLESGGEIAENMFYYEDKEVLDLIYKKIGDDEHYYSDYIIKKILDYYFEKLDYYGIVKTLSKIFIFNNYLNEEREDILVEHIGKDKYFDYLLFDVLIKCNLFFEYRKLLDKYLDYSDYTLNKILDFISHQEENKGYYTEYLFNKTKDRIVKKYNLNSKHYELIASKIGYEVLRYIDSDKIRKIINLDDNKFNKLLDLFEKENFDKNSVQALYDAAIQYNFGKKHADKINIRVNLISAIESNDPNYIKYIESIINIIKLDKNKFYNEYPKYKEYFGHEEDLLNDVVNKIKDDTIIDKNDYYNIIRDFCNYYIKYSREKYREKLDMHYIIDVPYEFEQKSVIKSYIKYFTAVSYKREIIAELEVTFNLSYMNASNVLDFYCGKNKHLDPKYQSQFGEYSKSITDFCSKRISMYNYKEYYQKVKELEKETPTGTKKIYDYSYTEDKRFKILMDLNSELLSEFILNDSFQKEYDKLKELIKKYKLLFIPDYFKSLSSNDENSKLGIDISFDSLNIKGFIEYFCKIYSEELSIIQSTGETEDKLDFGIISCLRKADSFSSTSDVYEMILGSEDARLVKSNPGPNAAQKQTSSFRLMQAVTNTIDNFKRQVVHIPTFNEVIELDNDKKLRAIVGNFTHSSNITHGERTGACMRIGGVGESLYNFCLNDTHGFHIRFEDPNTGKYISRVSGFRNGNTVFLNELRNSCDQNKYSDEDVIDVCTKTAQKLIELSKNSDFPIENVVIHRAYAMNKSPLKNTYLGVANIKVGLNNFYSDVDSKSIILASTGKPFTKLQLGSKNLPEYLPAREIPLEGKINIDVINKINRVKTIKSILNGADYEYVSCDVIDVEDVIYAIVNQDYFVYVDKEGNIISDMIDIDPRCKIEYSEAIEKAKLFILSRNKFKNAKKEESKEIIIEPLNQEIIIEENNSIKL